MKRRIVSLLITFLFWLLRKHYSGQKRLAFSSGILDDSEKYLLIIAIDFHIEKLERRAIFDKVDYDNVQLDISDLRKMRMYYSTKHFN
jgi:hypothetical protein